MSSGKKSNAIMSSIELQSVHGFDETPFQNGLIVGTNHVLYSTGRNIAKLNTDTKMFSLISCHAAVIQILGMAISSNQKYLAVAERHEHQMFINISVYNVTSGLLSRHMAVPDTQAESGHVLGMAFSNNNKVLVVHMGEPDYMLIVFKWFTGKVLKSVRGERDVFKVTFNPHEPSSASTVLTASPQSLRFWRCDEDSLRHTNSIIPKVSV